RPEAGAERKRSRYRLPLVVRRENVSPEPAGRMRPEAPTPPPCEPRRGAPSFAPAHVPGIRLGTRRTSSLRCAIGCAIGRDSKGLCGNPPGRSPLGGAGLLCEERSEVEHGLGH